MCLYIYISPVGWSLSLSKRKEFCWLNVLHSCLLEECLSKKLASPDRGKCQSGILIGVPRVLGVFIVPTEFFVLAKESKRRYLC